MPEVYFRVRWPDGTVEQCYSPSSVISDHLSAGTEYTVADFMNRTRRALSQASRRVEQVYGYPCSRALAQIDSFEGRYATESFAETAIVTCLELSSSRAAGAAS
jgi:putative flavoprotein involved in K+ transport